VRRSTSPTWWSDLAKAATICVALAATAEVAGVRAAEKAASNLDLMQDLTAQVVKELYGKFGPQLAGRAVQLKPAANSEDYLFVTNVFREELTKLGVTVIEPTAAFSAPGASPTTNGTAPNNAALSAMPSATNPAQAPADSSAGAPPSGAYVLQYQNVAFSLKYVDSHRSFVVGGKRVERNAAVRIMTTLSDPADGRVVWVGEAARDHSDEVDYGDAARLEQGSYAFNKPLLPSGGWGRYVEPVFVTGIIVGLIYLFFSNQSNN
jgi:hypothetical protein